MDALRRALLGGLVVFVAYCWMIRLSADLVWDEALNFKTYARHPLTAVALYHEPNNHPLDSLAKSVFFGVLGWSEPSFFRFTGFLWVIGWLALAWAWHRRLEREGSLVAATALVLTMILSSALNFQATVLRGYFLSMLLQFLYLFLLDRDAGWLDGAAPAGGAWNRRTVLRCSILGALILFTVPSNVLAMPALWLLTGGATAPPGGLEIRGVLTRAAKVAAVTLAITVVLYAPIIAGLVGGISLFHGTPQTDVHDASRAIGAEFALMARQLAPRGVDSAAYGLALLAIGIAALLFRKSQRATWLALWLAIPTVVLRLGFAVAVGVPARIKSSLVPPLAMAAVAWIHVLARRGTARAQNLAGIALVLGGYATIPHLVATEPFHRSTSTMAAFVATYGRPSERRILVAHEGIEPAIPYLHRAIGPDQTVSGLDDLEARLDSAPPSREDSWQRRLRDAVLGRRELAPALDLAAVDALVLIESDHRATGAFSWKHAAIELLRSRLTRVSRFTVGHYRLMIFERP